MPKRPGDWIPSLKPPLGRHMSGALYAEVSPPVPCHLMAHGLYLPNGFSAAKQCSKWIAELTGQVRSSLYFTGRQCHFFPLKWLGYPITLAYRNASQRIQSKWWNTGKERKTSLFVMSSFLQLGSVCQPRVKPLQIPGSEARTFNRMLLSACSVPGSVLKAHPLQPHTTDAHGLRLQDSNSSWVHLQSLSFLQSFIQAQEERATFLVSQCSEHPAHSLAHIRNPQIFCK